MRGIRINNSFCSYLIAVRLWHLHDFLSTSFGFVSVRVRAFSDASKFSGFSMQKTLTSLLQAEKLAGRDRLSVRWASQQLFQHLILGLGCWFWRPWSLWDVWLENRSGSLGSGVEVTLASPSGLSLLLLSLRRSEEVLTHILTTRSLPCCGGSQGKSLLQRAIFHKKKKSN